MIPSGNCNDCGKWADAMDRHRRCPSCHTKRDDALENLCEVAGMYCERLPDEISDALHAIPFNEKLHTHAT